MRGLTSLLAVSLPILTLAAKEPFGRIKNLITFGDSYTDISLASFPLWPIYASEYAGISFMDFARAGATCSNALTPRTFPGVVEDEIPAFLNATKNGKSLKADETLFTLWIGTNDVGVGELITGQANAGVSIVNTSVCAVEWVSRMHAFGARNFLFQNMIPLNLVPLYQANSYPNKYWDEQRNTTEWNVFMKELVASGNMLTELMLANLAPTLRDSNICVFDSHGLFTDIVANPTVYLNGTLPLNTTGASSACVFQLNEDTSGPSDCTIHLGAASDSFVWFDELHPTEQSQRIVAREITKAVNGTSTRWLKCFS
ncbi:carbohydrate esterase family 16 protein [Sphaerobolus stellatus SS14]|uniref:Carbohydrate esterase family 16 protein n=1 Tax=Sphaerobolus stellatus (strain SS14) TaxID=990650 RepID=A0A0C9UMZ8_SPHS4|nr:carbohydrate esterase family 16 protein [Sphaerobolus stellatus SS14]